MLFRRVQTLYDYSTNLSDPNTVRNFKIKYQDLDGTKRDFSQVLDDINGLSLEIEEDYKPDYAALDAFLDLVGAIRLAANELFSETPKYESLNSSSKLTSSSPLWADPSLPRIELPTFSGELTEWPTFYETFKNKIHLNKKLSVDDKMYYLAGKVMGKAASIFSKIPPTGSNYGAIWQALVDRYQDLRTQANAYMKLIIEFKAIQMESETNLKLFLDRFDSAVSAMKNLNIPDLSEFILGYIAMSKLDSQTLKFFELSRSNTDTLPSYKDIVEFIRAQAKTLNHAVAFSKASTSYPSGSGNFRSKQPQSFIVSQGHSNKCNICNKSPKHAIYRCDTFKQLTPHKRYELAKENSLCINCLSSQHKTNLCDSKNKCSICFAKHHTFLHFEKSNSNVTRLGDTGTHVCTSASNKHSTSDENTADHTFAGYSSSNTSATKRIVLLSTVVVNFVDKYNKVSEIRMLLDSGSESHFLTQDCVRRLGLPVSKIYTSVVGIGQTSRFIKGKTELVIHSRFDHNIKYSLECLIIDKISTQSPPSMVNSKSMTHLKYLPLADEKYHAPSPIDGIIGADLFAQLVGTVKVTGSSTLPAALETTLGFVVMGSAPAALPSISKIQTFCSFETPLETVVSKFWEIEDLATSFPIISDEDKECEKLFTSTYSRDTTGRYMVSLPFKQDPSCLGNSEIIASRRFLSLEKRLINSPSLQKLYCEVIRDYLSQGHMVRIDRSHDDSSPYYYIPHHGVERFGHPSTPLRVVFDASAKSDSSVSLNEVLYTGQKLQTDIVTILLNFRLFQVAILSDIKQMYRQIKLIPEHRRFQRILWRFSPQDKLETYELTTVSFGVTASPYLALRVIKQLAADEASSFPVASEFIKDSMYVDDICGSVKNVKEAKLLVNQALSLFKAGGFSLVKWSSNFPEVLKGLPDNICLPHNQVSFDDTDFQKVLGLQWNARSDHFSFKVHTFSNVCSKRNILSTVARIFDPIGILSPITLFAKFLIKEIWKLKIGWDELPCSRIRYLWSQFQQELPSLSSLTIPRHLWPGQDTTSTLVGFADASCKGYAAVVYLRTVDKQNNTHVSLVMAKAKVSPMKLLSIPRLELLAAVLLSKLLKFVVDIYNPRYAIESIYAFSDSQVVLSWIHSEPYRWKTFVGNRITKIHENLSAKNWYFVDGQENPADCASRGLSPKLFLQNSTWFTGPDWLKLDHNYWPLDKFRLADADEAVANERATVSYISVEKEPHPLYDLIIKFSNYQSLLRCTVYALRFARKLPRQTEITVEDLNVAELFLCKVVQGVHFASEFKLLAKNQNCTPKIRKLRPFLKDDVIRVGGRISHSTLSYDVCHPIILPKNDAFVNLLIRYYHNSHAHAGPNLVLSLIRQKFWILSARVIIRKITQSCNWCFRQNPRPRFPLMADLPTPRVTPSKPFLHTGVDYAGPFNITFSRKRGLRSQKAYLCLFVCLSTKALHLELASDLSTQKFVDAFKRFISRRGQVSIVYCDNGTNFVGAKSYLEEVYRFINTSAYNNALREELLKNRINLKFNPPYGQHMAGLMEAGVKSAKKLIFKIIGTQILTYEELVTVLNQVEAILNSRPLCCLSSDPAEPSALTPAHFIHTAPLPFIPTEDVSETSPNLLTRHKLLDNLVQSYWKRYRDEYLLSLQQRQRWNTPSAPVKPGTVVILMKETAPPLHWPLGVVEEVYPGSDGVVRIALVRTCTGLYKRPVVRLCPLPTQ